MCCCCCYSLSEECEDVPCVVVVCEVGVVLKGFLGLDVFVDKGGKLCGDEECVLCLCCCYLLGM